MEMRKSPHVGLLTYNMWRKFNCVYVMRLSDKLVGVCAVVKLKNWVKIGPVIILSKYQGKGYGKKLLSKVITDFPDKNLYIGSSSPAVISIVKRLGFTRMKNFFGLPRKIKIYLVKYFLERLNLGFAVDDFRKKSFLHRDGYSYFVRYSDR